MMQVLVALRRANSHVVTRDELIDICWNGRIVGEDAVHRVLWRLRRLLAKLGNPGFEIATIPRVGYRLDADPVNLPPIAAGHPVDSFELPDLSRRKLATGVAALAGLAAIGGFAWAGSQRPHEPPQEAKRFFDQAIDLRGQGGFAQSQQVLAYLREAVRIDPEYSEAWGALALQYIAQLDWSTPRPDARQLKIAGRSAAQRALQLDSNNADASLALLSIDSPYGRWAHVEHGLRALLARHPGNDHAEFGLAKIMIETGRFAAAMKIFKQLAVLRPSWPYVRWRSADALLALGRLQEAEEEIEIGLRLWPRQLAFWISKSRLMLINGDEANAVRYVRDRSAQPLNADTIVEREILITEAAAERSGGSVRRARDALVNLARSGEVAIPAMELPFIGEVDLAFEMYEGYFLDRGRWKTGPVERRYTGGLFEVETEQLRKDARFMPLVRAIGLANYYSVAGVRPDFLQV